MVYLAFFSFQLADTVNNFKVILAAREKEIKNGLSNVFLNTIYFRHVEHLHRSYFLTVSYFLVNHWTIFS